MLAIRRHNYSPLKKSCFYRRRLISQWPLLHILTPQSLTLIVLNPDGQNQSQSQVHTNCFPYITTTGFLNPPDFSNTSKCLWETHIYCPAMSYTTAQLTLHGHLHSFLLKRCLPFTFHDVLYHCRLYSLQQGQRNFFGWRFCLKLILGAKKKNRKRPFLNKYEYRVYIYRIYVDIIGQMIRFLSGNRW